MNKIITFDAVYKGKEYRREVVLDPKGKHFVIIKDKCDD